VGGTVFDIAMFAATTTATPESHVDETTGKV
jgi:hypothetical protein